jgi:hypothetical protein
MRHRQSYAHTGDIDDKISFSFGSLVAEPVGPRGGTPHSTLVQLIRDRAFCCPVFRLSLLMHHHPPCELGASHCCHPAILHWKYRFHVPVLYSARMRRYSLIQLKMRNPLLVVTKPPIEALGPLGLVIFQRLQIIHFCFVLVF